VFTLSRTVTLPRKEYGLLAGFLHGRRDNERDGVTTARALEFLEDNGLTLRLSEASTLRSRLQKKGYIRSPETGDQTKGRGTSYAVTQKGLADIHVASAQYRHLANLVPAPDTGAEDERPVSGSSSPNHGGDILQLVTDNAAKA